MKHINDQETKKLHKKEILILIVTLAAVLAVFLLSIRYLDSGDTNNAYRKRSSNYSHGWTILIDGERMIKDLPAHVVSGKDGTITLKKKLPAAIPSHSAIATRNYHQIMEVKIDGELVFRYPDDSWDGLTSLLSDEWCIIDLSPKNSRSVLEIKYINITNMDFDGNIMAIYYGNDNSVIQYIRSMTAWQFASGLMVIVLGVILLVISWIYRKFTNQTSNTAMGLVFFCMGLWMTNRSKMPFLETNNNAAFIFSMFAMLMVPPFIFLYCYFRNKGNRKIALRGFQICTAYAGFILLTVFFINYNVEMIMMICYIMALLAVLTTAWLLFRSSFGKDAALRSRMSLLLDRSELVTTAIFPIGVIMEMIINSDQLWTDIGNIFRVALVLYAWAYMIILLWRTYLVVRDSALISERLQESQLELMMGQIQPHFIFNTISSIRTLVKIDPDVAYKMLYDFSNYLRANVDNVTNLSGIKFASEVEHIKSYVNIEKVRFGDRLNVEYDITVTDFTVPPLSIQPLVENAIKHGVFKKPEGGTVSLKSYEDGDNYVVKISDDGVGFSKEAAAQIFSIYESDDEKLGMESNNAIIKTMKEVMANLNLMDEEGQPIELSGPVKRSVNLTGNGSEDHQSKGLMNIFLRLREISDAQIYITSTMGKGTDITVLFPKQEDEE